MTDDSTYNGIFTPADVDGSGHLTIAGANSALKLVTTPGRLLKNAEYQDFHGLLADGRCASALECIRQGSSQRVLSERPKAAPPGRPREQVDYFPHYIVIGETYINSGERLISAIQYHFENASRLVNGHRTFQSLHPTPDEARRLLEGDHRRKAEMAKQYNWGDWPFDPEIGDHPQLHYFSGVWEIAKIEAEVGTVSLHNQPTSNFGGSEGIWFKNQILIVLRFHKAHNLADATRALYRLHNLFELALGRRQRLLKIELETAHATKKTPDAPAEPLHELHWSYCNEAVQTESESAHSGDALLDAVRRRQEFTNVVSGWLNSGPALAEARGRFAAAFYGTYGVDRLVGAANMFDLLPEDRVPRALELTADMREAVEKCRAIFKVLPNSFARQSVLSALGRVGLASLRDKVLHRSEVVHRAVPNRFVDLHIPIIEAVRCRNHFVHGSDAAFDYTEEFGSFAFLTNTLEFVFAISDLLELGWSFQTWSEHGLGMSTELSSYVVNYKAHLTELKAVLAAQSAS